MLLMSRCCVGGTDNKVGVLATPTQCIDPVPNRRQQLSRSGDVIDFGVIIADGQDSIEDPEILWTSDLQGSLLGGDLPQGDGTVLQHSKSHRRQSRDHTVRHH